MTDIKPDTSLYTDLPSRLRAMALVLEGAVARMQYRCASNGGVWMDCGAGNWPNSRRIEKVLSDSAWEYRLKPAPPAKLHVGVTDDGRPAHTYACGGKFPYPPQMPGTTRVTYVLENPDAND